MVWKIREIDCERLTTWRSITPTCIIFETLFNSMTYMVTEDHETHAITQITRC